MHDFTPISALIGGGLIGAASVWLLAGAALFGIGWGIAGYCPGPALTALSTLSAESVVFVAAIIAGGRIGALVVR